MKIDAFQRLLQPVMDTVAGRAVDQQLAEALNTSFPCEGGAFRAIEAACHEAISDGWMCAQGGEGRRFGRVVEPGAETHDLSVDVVDLQDVVGPHHRHPKGEICMVMPVDEAARFNDNPRGWCVFEPGSDHFPTVEGGRSLVLYLLPGGEIEFTGLAAP
ncbi:MAG: DUF4863 family protein [Gammaproteobacteria bacterium]|nr:DUF4863 family protein [Gammaproteobacteria bacterium]